MTLLNSAKKVGRKRQNDIRNEDYISRQALMRTGTSKNLIKGHEEKKKKTSQKSQKDSG